MIEKKHEDKYVHIKKSTFVVALALTIISIVIKIMLYAYDRKVADWKIIGMIVIVSIGMVIIDRI